MAKFGSKRTQENEPTIQVEAAEEEILLPGEGPTESAAENAFDPSAIGDIADNSQEESEMTEVETTVAEKPLAERLEDDGYKVTDAAKNLLAEAEGNAVTMLEIDSLPKDARVVKMQLNILEELAQEYTELRNELAEGTSGKDEKVQSYIANLDESEDESGKAFRDAFEAAQEARQKAIDAANEAEAAFLAHVENELSKRGGGVMSEEDIKAKTAEIKLKYGEYAEQHKAAKSFLDNYRTHKNAEVGEIHQYVTHIDRPSGGRASTGTRNNGPSAGRSVHVSGAFFSRDNGVTWEHSTTQKTDAQGKQITLSNPASLAIDLGKAFSTTVAKDDIVDAWYAASGQTRETASKANMPNEKTFGMTIKNGEGKETDVLVKLQKRQ